MIKKISIIITVILMISYGFASIKSQAIHDTISQDRVDLEKFPRITVNLDNSYLNSLYHSHGSDSISLTNPNDQHEVPYELYVQKSDTTNLQFFLMDGKLSGDDIKYIKNTLSKAEGYLGTRIAKSFVSFQNNSVFPLGFTYLTETNYKANLPPVKVNDYISTLARTPNSNRVLIFFYEEFGKKQYDMFNEFRRSSTDSSGNVPGIIVLSNGIEDDFAGALAKEKIAWLDFPIFRNASSEKTKKAIQGAVNSSRTQLMKITFLFPDDFAENEYGYLALTFHLADTSYEAILKIRNEATDDLSPYLSFLDRKMRYYLHDSDYAASLSYLEKLYESAVKERKNSDTALFNPTDSICLTTPGWLNWMNVNPHINPLRFFRPMSDLWNCLSEEANQEVFLLLDKYYHSGMCKTTEDSIMVLKGQYSLKPDSIQLNLEALLLEVRLLEAQDKMLQAADKLSEYLILKKDDNEIKVRMRKDFIEGIRKSYENKSYTEVIIYGDRQTDKELRSNLQVLYYQGMSHRNVGQFETALELLREVIYNWEDNKIPPTYLDLNIIIQDLMLKTGKLQESIALNKNLYRTLKEEKYLNRTILAMRTIYIKPILDIYPLIADALMANENSQSALSAQNIQYNHFYAGVYLLDNKGDMIRNFLLSDHEPLPTENLLQIKDFPALIVNEKEDRVWAVNKSSGNQYFVLEISLTYTDAEKSLVSRIVYNSDEEEPWYNLSEEEENLSWRSFMDLMTSLITIKVNKVEGNTLLGFWDKLRKNEIILYMMVSDQTGRIIESYGFDSSKSSFNQDIWAKSLTTLAFLWQRGEYDQKECVDLTNPLLQFNSLRYSLKIGLERIRP